MYKGHQTLHDSYAVAINKCFCTRQDVHSDELKINRKHSMANKSISILELKNT